MDDDEDDDGPRNLNKPNGDKKSMEKIKREHEASSLRDKLEPVPLMLSVRPAMFSHQELEQVPVINTEAAMASMAVVRSEDHDEGEKRPR